MCTNCTRTSSVQCTRPPVLFKTFFQMDTFLILSQDSGRIQKGNFSQSVFSGMVFLFFFPLCEYFVSLLNTSHYVAISCFPLSHGVWLHFLCVNVWCIIYYVICKDACKYPRVHSPVMFTTNVKADHRTRNLHNLWVSRIFHKLDRIKIGIKMRN